MHRLLNFTQRSPLLLSPLPSAKQNLVKPTRSACPKPLLSCCSVQAQPGHSAAAAQHKVPPPHPPGGLASLHPECGAATAGPGRARGAGAGGAGRARCGAGRGRGTCP